MKLLIEGYQSDFEGTPIYVEGKDLVKACEG